MFNFDISWLYSWFSFLTKAQKNGALEYHSSDLNELMEMEQRERRERPPGLIIGHDSTLFALFITLCVLKWQGRGGIIVLVGENQRATKKKIVEKLSSVWAHLWNAQTTKLVIANATTFGNDACEVERLRVKFCVENTTVWVRKVQTGSPVLQLLQDQANLIHQSKVLFILEADKDLPSKITVDKSVLLSPDVAEIEEMVADKWFEVAYPHPLSDQHMFTICSTVAREATLNALEKSIQFLKCELDDAAKAETDAEAKDTEQPAPKKVKSDFSVEVSGQSQAHAFSDSNSNTTATDSHNPTTLESNNTAATSANSLNTSSTVGSHNNTNSQPKAVVDRADILLREQVKSLLSKGNPYASSRTVELESSEIHKFFDREAPYKRTLSEAHKMVKKTSAIAKEALPSAETMKIAGAVGAKIAVESAKIAVQSAGIVKSSVPGMAVAFGQAYTALAHVVKEPETAVGVASLAAPVIDTLPSPIQQIFHGGVQALENIVQDKKEKEEAAKKEKEKEKEAAAKK